LVTQAPYFELRGGFHFRGGKEIAFSKNTTVRLDKTVTVRKKLV
jgi:hypothetical protein